MKNLITTLALAGSLVLGGCGDNEKKQLSSTKQITELEKYNLENKRIYEDFLKFCLENPNKEKMSIEKHYVINLLNNNIIDFTESGYISLFINGKNFYDNDGNGLDNEFLDSQVFTDKKTNLIENEWIKDMPPEKQFSVAKEYTSLLKEILHEEKYKNY